MNFVLEIKSYKSRIKYLLEKILGIKPSSLKLQLIDVAFENNKIHSFADLGGVWGVDGAYTFYILTKHTISRGYIVDDHFTRKVVKQSTLHPQLQLIDGDFRFHKTLDKIDKVDLILLFDVLLHQVNWQEVLSFCTQKGDILAVYNPQLRGENSVRLLDLGEKEYFNLVPHTKKGVHYRDVFTSKKVRDAPDIWQWGICDIDLIGTLEKLDFHLVYSLDGDFWPNRVFRSKGFIFRRSR